LYLDEEFTNPLDLDCDPNFTWSDGGLTEGSVRFVKSQISFANGNMIITADNKPAALTIPTYTYAENVGVPPPPAVTLLPGRFQVQPQISGELRTKYNNYRYGWYEARYKPPTTTNGNFISAFFVFRTPRLQDWQEIDIEDTPMGAGPGPNMVGTSVYYNLNNGGAGFAGGHADYLNEPLPGGVTNNEADFHVYAFEWQPTFIKWYFDGTLIRTKMGVAGAAVPIPKESVKMFMNLWIFNTSAGFGGGNPANNVYPMQAQYDYVRFYKLNDATIEPTYPCSPVPSCLVHRDITASKNNPEDGVPFLYP
jgi:beta-glucanase (GH16 family)